LDSVGLSMPYRFVDHTGDVAVDLDAPRTSSRCSWTGWANCCFAFRSGGVADGERRRSGSPRREQFALSEWCPNAYNDVEDVVGVMHGPAITRRVALLRRLGVIKG